MSDKTVKRLASLDLGTNTFLLLIAEVDGDRIEPLLEKETMVRLGKGVDANGNLDEAAMARGLECLRLYVESAEKFQCEAIHAVGTSALRDAANREEFIRRVKTETGIAVQVISGEMEARLTFLGALSNKRDLPEPVSIIDVGGGSTEVVMGTRERRIFARSADIGSVRLTERLLHSDPVKPTEIEAFRQHVEQTMLRTWPKSEMKNSQSLLGTAGTITTLAGMAQSLAEYDPARVDTYVLTSAKLSKLINALASRTIAERKLLAGLNPARADVILAGALILQEFLQIYGFNEIVVSHRGLRYGVLIEE